MNSGWRTLVAAMLLLVLGPAAAAEARVAVAANFALAARTIAAAFTAATGHRALLTFGATGQIYAQIAQAAPFDVFLAADRARPASAVDAGLAVDASRFTYARGRLVLYARAPGLALGPETLEAGAFDRLAIANPETAPYGAAAMDVMQALGVERRLAARLVRGNSVAQAYQFVSTGNAEFGFVALSQVAGHAQGSRWLVPEDLHRPIAQDAVLLAAGENNVAARAFLEYLRGDAARAIIARHGYLPGRLSPVVDFAELWPPVRLTLQLASVSTLVLLLAGTPVAWWLARSRARWKEAVATVVAMPLVLPPTVLGFYLLIALGPDGPGGAVAGLYGARSLAFTFEGLVIGSVIYSMPFVVQPIRNAFEAIGDRPLEVAATLRASPVDAFWSVAVPLARPGFVTGTVLGFAHTVGEFGVVLMIGGNIPGETRVLSIALYDYVETLRYAEAHVLAGGMLVFAFVVILSMTLLERRLGRPRR